MTFVPLSLKGIFENKFWMHRNKDERDALIFCLEKFIFSKSLFCVTFAS